MNMLPTIRIQPVNQRLLFFGLTVRVISAVPVSPDVAVQLTDQDGNPLTDQDGNPLTDQES